VGTPRTIVSITIVISLRPPASCTILTMGVSLLLLGFLQRVAVGAGTVFAMLLVVWLGIPRRSVIVVSHRTLD